MPEFRQLSKEEVKNYRAPATGERAKVREEYRGYLKDLEIGEGGELLLTEDEKKVTIKNRLKRAAKDLDVELEFKRSGTDVVRFCIAGRGKSK